MNYSLTFYFEQLGSFDIVIPTDIQIGSWNDAKLYAKQIGKGYRLPYDFELEEMFKSSLFRGLLHNSSYWSATETASTRARSQQYRNGGNFRSMWQVHPGDIEEKNTLNFFFFIRKRKLMNIESLFSNKVLELALYDSIRKTYHPNNYVRNGLSRSDIFNLYKKENFTKRSFVQMLMWGGIRTVNLGKVLEHNPRELKNKLIMINSLIANKNGKEIIDQYLLNRDIRISGVNLSFITKHMHFIRPNRFLIYDRFMINLHVAMMLKDDPTQILRYFKKSNISSVYSIRYKMHGMAYADFLNRFNSLFIKVNVELAKRGVRKFKKIGDLEAFLFGSAKPNQLSNPRIMVQKFISENSHLVTAR